MKRLTIDYRFKKVNIEIKRQSIGDEEVFHILTTPTIWGLTETFDDATEAAVYLAGYIEDILANMAHNAADTIRLKCSWE